MERGKLETRSLKKSLKALRRWLLEKVFKTEGKRTGGLNPMQSWYCWQIENEEEEGSWQEGHQMEEQWGRGTTFWKK